jgi:hypothetical protein
MRTAVRTFGPVGVAGLRATLHHKSSPVSGGITPKTDADHGSPKASFFGTRRRESTGAVRKLVEPQNVAVSVVQASRLGLPQHSRDPGAPGCHRQRSLLGLTQAGKQVCKRTITKEMRSGLSGPLALFHRTHHPGAGQRAKAA